MFVLRGVLAFGAIVIAFLWVAIGARYLDERTVAEQNALRENENLVRVFEENVLRSIGEIDKALLYLRHTIELQGGAADLPSVVATADVLSEILVQVAVIDAKGIMRASSAGPQPAPPIDLSDRLHYRFHLTNDADTLYISRPLIGRVSGKWSVQFTRRLRGPDGGFAGVVVASLDPRHLARFYDGIDFGSATSIALIGSDGIVRSSGGSRSGFALGDDVSASPLFRAAREGGGGSIRTSAAPDGGPRLVTHRAVRGQPLWLAVDRDLAGDLDDPWSNLVRNAAIALAVTAAIVAALVEFARSDRRSREQERQLRLTLENMSQGIMLVDPSGRVPVFNARCVDLLGLPPRLVDDPKGAGPEELAVIDAAVHGGTRAVGPRADVEYTVGERRTDDGRVVEIRNGHLGEGFVVCTLTDVTERKAAEVRIARLAVEDPLTGLPNRRSLSSALSEQLDACRTAAAHGAERTFAVFFLDVDRFKTINDSLGHRIGDLLLTEIGRRLRRAAPADHLIARLGGDEFAVLVPSNPTTEALVGLAGRLIDAISETFPIDGYHLRVSTSIGIAVAPRDGADIDGLLAAADLALYAVKADRRGGYRFYDPSLREGVEERRAIEHDLRVAVEQNGLSLAYQPILDLDGDFVSGFEALARWRHPTRGWIPPATFIPIAEESGLIVDLGAWALRTACRTMAALPEPLVVAVNLSPIQLLMPRFTDFVAGVLAETGLAPQRLELEVTERILLQNAGQTLDVLRDLGALGLRIVLDDFGTGYSSLSYLRNFPFDKVKIDRSFVSDLTLGTDRTVIVQAVVSIGKALGMRILAEGVETSYQRELLTALGCDEAQGWEIARPMPAEAIADFLRARPAPARRRTPSA